MVKIITSSAVPVIVFITAIIILFSKEDLGSEFLKGAKEGFETSVSLVPTLVLLVSAIRMLTNSGAVDFLCNLLSPLASFLGFSPKILPALLLRPFSASATTAVADSIFSLLGPDSIESLTLCILMGSSDTILYTISLYYSESKIKNTAFSIPISFICLLFCTILSARLCVIFF